MGLIRILEEQASQHRFDTIRVIRLDVGKLSCVEPEALRFCFETAKAGTVADGAELDLVIVPGTARCRDCGQVVSLDSYLDPCPSCGVFGLQAASGTDLRIKELEVD